MEKTACSPYTAKVQRMVHGSSSVNILAWSWIFFCLPRLWKYSHTQPNYHLEELEIQLHRHWHIFPTTLWSSLPPDTHIHKCNGRLNPGIYIDCLSLLNHCYCLYIMFIITLLFHLQPTCCCIIPLFGFDKNDLGSCITQKPRQVYKCWNKKVVKYALSKCWLWWSHWKCFKFLNYTVASIHVNNLPYIVKQMLPQVMKLFQNWSM